MSAFLPRRLAGLALVLMLALATSGAAVAHRLSSGGPADQALAVYLALGGKLTDLCGDAPLARAHCDACRPLGAAPPATPIRVARAEPPFVGAGTAIILRSAAPSARTIGPGPARGPPAETTRPA